MMAEPRGRSFKRQTEIPASGSVSFSNSHTSAAAAESTREKTTSLKAGRVELVTDHQWQIHGGTAMGAIARSLSDKKSSVRKLSDSVRVVSLLCQIAISKVLRTF